MSLRVLPTLVQGTDEWHDQRRGMVTASVVGQLVTAKPHPHIEVTCMACKAAPDQMCVSIARNKQGAVLKAPHSDRIRAAERLPQKLGVAENEGSRTLTALLVSERITGWTEPTFINSHTMRGIADEPRAVATYSAHYAPVESCGFMVRDDWGYPIGYSPDGLVGDDGLIEVKSRAPRSHLKTILADSVPAENMAQIQTGLLVSGRQWCDYLSYCGGMPMWSKRVYPDSHWFGAIVAAVAAFEARAAEMVATYQQRTQGLPATERVLEMEVFV